jgi:hypothetical protein
LRLKTFGWVSNLFNPFAAGWDPFNKYLEGLKPLDGLETSVILLQLGGIKLTNALRIKTFGWVRNLCNPPMCVNSQWIPQVG